MNRTSLPSRTVISKRRGARYEQQDTLVKRLRSAEYQGSRSVRFCNLPATFFEQLSLHLGKTDISHIALCNRYLATVFVPILWRSLWSSSAPFTRNLTQQDALQRDIILDKNGSLVRILDERFLQHLSSQRLPYVVHHDGEAPESVQQRRSINHNWFHMIEKFIFRGKLAPSMEIMRWFPYLKRVHIIAYPSMMKLVRCAPSSRHNMAQMPMSQQQQQQRVLHLTHTYQANALAKVIDSRLLISHITLEFQEDYQLKVTSTVTSPWTAAAQFLSEIRPKPLAVFPKRQIGVIMRGCPVTDNPGTDIIKMVSLFLVHLELEHRGSHCVSQLTAQILSPPAATSHGGLLVFPAMRSLHINLCSYHHCTVCRASGSYSEPSPEILAGYADWSPAKYPMLESLEIEPHNDCKCSTCNMHSSDKPLAAVKLSTMLLASCLNSGARWTALKELRASVFLSTFKQLIEACPNLTILSLNIYRGDSTESVFDLGIIGSLVPWLQTLAVISNMVQLHCSTKPSKLQFAQLRKVRFESFINCQPHVLALLLKCRQIDSLELRDCCFSGNSKDEAETIKKMVLEDATFTIKQFIIECDGAEREVAVSALIKRHTLYNLH
ncbi:hypothetical protein GQ42DRAFT_70270 [Ramicandelaber brevisporus]|nr:hypothetical protein GQ42DRAFT_70270 [Ramicandelaber brevisporus]